jgi:hypothetical protein
MLPSKGPEPERALAHRWRGCHVPPLALGLAAFLSYVGVVVLLLPGPGSLFQGNNYVGVRSHPTLYIWAFAWWPYALTHGINPLLTHVIWAPQGANIAWNGDTPGLALMAWPLTALFGPVVSFNLVTLSAPVLAALATYLVCYEFTRRFWPSLLGGWLFGFSTYEMAQLLGHLQVNFIAEIPLLLWLSILCYRGRITIPLFMVGAAALLTFEFGVGVELYTTTAVFAVLGIIVSYVLVKKSRGALIRVAGALAGAYALSLLIISPYLYFFVGSASGVPSIINSPERYSADLLNFFTPTPITALGGPLLAGVTNHFSGNLVENDAYLGLPLILIVCLCAWQGRRRPWVWVLAATFLLVAIAELGPRLHILGSTNYAIGIVHLPWDIATKVPGLRDALPGRFAMYLSLLAAIMAALWLAAPGHHRMARIGLALAALVFLWTNPLTISTPPPVQLLGTNAYLGVLRYRSTLLFLPYGELGDSMLWQAQDGFDYRLASGTGTVQPASFARSPAVEMFLSGKRPARYKDDILEFCRRHDVAAILVTTGTKASIRAAIRRLGWRTRAAGLDRLYWAPGAAKKT